MWEGQEFENNEILLNLKNILCQLSDTLNLKSCWAMAFEISLSNVSRCYSGLGCRVHHVSHQFLDTRLTFKKDFLKRTPNLKRSEIWFENNLKIVWVIFKTIHPNCKRLSEAHARTEPNLIWKNIQKLEKCSNICLKKLIWP